MDVRITPLLGWAVLRFAILKITISSNAGAMLITFAQSGTSTRTGQALDIAVPLSEVAGHGCTRRSNGCLVICLDIMIANSTMMTIAHSGKGIMAPDIVLRFPTL